MDAATEVGPHELSAMSASRPSPTDSPWFWVGLFAWAAILGLVAIGPKYAQRQEGLERRQEGRETGWRQRVETPSGESATEPRDAPPGSSRTLARRMLLPLVAMLALVWLAATWALLSRRRRARMDVEGVPLGQESVENRSPRATVAKLRPGQAERPPRVRGKHP